MKNEDNRLPSNAFEPFAMQGGVPRIIAYR
jgi:hypothetical protein